MSQYPSYLNQQLSYPMNSYPQYGYPSQDRLQQWQQQMLQNSTFGNYTGVFAKFVDTFENITANDVPMNGGALFVKNDGSEIEYRSWKADGTISKTLYLAQKSSENSQTIKTSKEEEKLKLEVFSEVLEGIQSDLEILNNKIDKLTKPVKAKKEASEDE